MGLKDELKKQAKEEKPEIKRERPKRRGPLNGKQVLTVDGKEDGYFYRIFNDVGDRIAIMKERGYEVVDAKDVRVGERGASSPEGTPATAFVGGGVKGVVMRIPQEWKDEDDALRQKEVDSLEAATKSTTNADYGSIVIDKGQK